MSSCANGHHCIIFRAFAAGGRVPKETTEDINQAEGTTMQLKAIKTPIITVQDHTIDAILDLALPEIQEGEILAVTSKIVALFEGRAVPLDAASKAELVMQEADLYLPATVSRYAVYLTIKNSALMPWAGIDESNSDGHHVLWPGSPQQAANEMRAYLCRRFALKHAGVLITDSRPLPLRWGVTGFSVAHSGFAALHDYRGAPDLFGRPLRMTQANIADALAAAAVLVMGEGSEQTPLALISDLPFVVFQDRDPSAEELAELAVSLEDDLYAPLLSGAAWARGGAGI